MKKSGFTLMELLVYIAIMGIVVLVAGQAFSDSAKMRIRTESMLSASQIANNIGTILSDDIAQMGAKSSKESSSTTDQEDVFGEAFEKVYIDPLNANDTQKDSSSFVLSSSGDDFKFRRIRYNNGTLFTVEEVRWFLDGNVLKRSCWTVATKSDLASTGGAASSSSGSGVLPATDPCSATTAEEATAVEVARDITEFKIIAGKPRTNEDDVQVFPASGNQFMLVPRFGEPLYNYLNVDNSGETSTLSGFALNFDKTNNRLKDEAESPENVQRNQLYAAEFVSNTNFTTNLWKSTCASTANKFDLKPNATYEISFILTPTSDEDKMAMFTPGRDFLSVGFRDNNGEHSALIDDFLFYPPTTLSAGVQQQTMRFTVPQEIKNQCLVFTFATYSPVVSEGSLVITNLKLKKVATANYDFLAWNTEASGNIKEKKNVKAFKVSVHVKKRGEEGFIEHAILAASNGPRD